MRSMTMAQKNPILLLKILLISAIILCSTAHILPWGTIDAEPFWTIDIYHWSGISASYSGEETVFEIILPWTNFTNETSSINTYLYAASSLLLYLMIPLSIGSIGLGLIVFLRPTQKNKKRILQAGITSTVTVIFSVLYILFGILPRMEARLSSISEAFHWTTGFYLMIAAAIIYFTIFSIIKKYPQILTPEKTIKPEKKEKKDE